MAKLPDFTSLGGPAIPQPAGGIASFQSAGMDRAGANLREAGGELHEAANIVAATNDRQDQIVAIAAANRLQERALELHLGQGGFNEAKGAAALGEPFLKTYQQKFDDVKSELEGALLNDNQRRVFQQHAPSVAMQYRSSLLRHQAAQTDHFNDQTFDSTISLAITEMRRNPWDEGARAAGIAKVDWALDQKAMQHGWSPEVKAATREKYLTLVNDDIADVIGERDPTGALAAYDKKLGIGTEAGPTGIAAIDALSADAAIKKRHRVLSVVTQANNQAAAEYKARLTEAGKTTEELGKYVTSGGLVDADTERRALADTAGTPFEAGVKGLISMSYAGSAHGSRTLEEQLSALRGLDAAKAQTGSGPEQEKFANFMREVTEKQRRDYKDNPWAAATRYGRRPPVPEVQITSADQVPKLIAERLPLMGVVEEYAKDPANGITAISPLQPAEAQAFAEKLKALPPEAKSEVLAQTGALLSGPRVAALAESLDKHDKPMALALKMGTDRTTTGRAASVLVLRGAQALADKTVKKEDTALAGWRAEIAGLVRGTLGDDKAEQDVIDAAYFARAGLEQADPPPGGLKAASASAENALAFIIGKPLERAGVKTFMPKGMDSERAFDEKIKAYTPEKLKEQAPAGVVYLRGQPVPLQNVANRLTQYGLKRDGQGRYIPTLNNAPFTIDPQGSQMLRLELR